MSEPKSNELLRRYQAGQSEAATEIFDRYVARLIALARARIGPRLKRRVDPEDIVQSAYRSFFLHAAKEEYQLARAGDLWRLLASTTLNKLYGQIEKQTAEKRTVDREVQGDGVLADLRTHEPTVVEAVAMGEQLSLILDALSNDERCVLTLTLQGQSPEEIGRTMDKSERTVRRLLQQARQKFENRLLRADTPGKIPSAPYVTELEAPLKFSNYVLEKLLGAGGMGKVYRATDKRTGASVAIKALHKARQSDERAVRQFVQESQILSRLRHPHIVAVEGLGRFPGGGHFLVMQLVEGVDLQSRLHGGPLPPLEAIGIVRDVARAIQHAHDQGIVHCDLKPGNVLLDHQHHVFVTDFGFAFILADASRTAVNGIGGTEGFLPPELFRLQGPPTRAADIFALGALLWTLVTGNPPKQLEACRDQSGASQPFEAICFRCLADDPNERYSTASDLIDALDGLSEG